MSTAALILPHQLFDPHPALHKSRPVYLLEDSLFFGDKHNPAQFHQQKLVLHRASMRAYADKLEHEGYETTYIDYDPEQTLDSALLPLAEAGVETLHYCDSVDYLVERRLQRFARRHSIELRSYETPMFLSSPQWLDEAFGNRSKKFLMADFYTKQRIRLGILIEDDDKPVGGKWSFDEENRKKLPKDLTLPEEPGLKANKWVKAAIRHVNEQFPKHSGDASGFRYPTTHAEADEWLEEFLVERFGLFGDYEDAISRDHVTLFHSVLTPMLNIGLLTPEQVVKRALDAAESEDVPLNSLEGFIRQVIGWREFMMGIYRRVGVEQRTNNFWNFERKIPASFYDGTTGIDPVDQVIKRVLDRAYCHHIERLMILGNFMCLCGFHPHEVYRWFMELFIDAYDWVMVPNVYGMSQFAGGGRITTKPYVSGSNYVRKMSDFPKGDWCETWDGLFWTFIAAHQEFFSKNPRLSMMTKQIDRMGQAKLEKHQDAAQAFLKSL